MPAQAVWSCPPCRGDQKERIHQAIAALEVPVKNGSRKALGPNLGFAASVAAFGMLLRGSEHKGTASWQQVVDLARRFRGEDPEGYRAEFIRLAELAAALDKQRRTTTS